MKRLISINDRDSYTFLLEILEALNIPSDYKWLITGVEAYPSDIKFDKKLNDQEVPLILTNSELISELNKEDFQWIWGTLSLFESYITDEQIRQFDMPDIYWNPEKFVGDIPAIQHPLAILEINPFDSTYVFINTDREDFLENFKYLFPLSKEEW